MCTKQPTNLTMSESPINSTIAPNDQPVDAATRPQHRICVKIPLPSAADCRSQIHVNTSNRHQKITVAAATSKSNSPATECIDSTNAKRSPLVAKYTSITGAGIDSRSLTAKSRQISTKAASQSLIGNAGVDKHEQSKRVEELLRQLNDRIEASKMRKSAPANNLMPHK